MGDIRYASLKKADLEVALDEHLRTNSTTYGRDPAMSEYYKRLGSDKRSPVKKLIEKVQDTVRSEEDAPAPAKKAKRKTIAPAEET